MNDDKKQFSTQRRRSQWNISEGLRSISVSGCYTQLYTRIYTTMKLLGENIILPLNDE